MKEAVLFSVTLPVNTAHLGCPQLPLIKVVTQPILTFTSISPFLVRTLKLLCTHLALQSACVDYTSYKKFLVPLVSVQNGNYVEYTSVCDWTLMYYSHQTKSKFSQMLRQKLRFLGYHSSIFPVCNEALSHFEICFLHLQGQETNPLAEGSQHVLIHESKASLAFFLPKHVDLWKENILDCIQSALSYHPLAPILQMRQDA